MTRMLDKSDTSRGPGRRAEQGKGSWVNMRVDRIGQSAHLRSLIGRFARGRNPGAAVVAVGALMATVALAVLPASAAAEQCSNAVYRTGPSSHLPDCRAYELVTPPFKGGGFPFFPMGVDPSGSSLTMITSAALTGAEGFPNVFIPFPSEMYATRRTATGWVSTPDDPPATEYIPYLENGFENFAGVGDESSSVQGTVWMARGAWQPENRIDFFKRNPDRSIADIGPALPPTAPSGGPSTLGEAADLRPDGLSADGSRLFFTISHYFWPGDGSEETGIGHRLPSLYEYAGAGNTAPRLVGVDSEGRQIGQCGDLLGGSATEHNAVSTDGRTVFFTVFGKDQTPECKGSEPQVGELFARIDNGAPEARTVAISEPSKEDCAACDTEAGVLADAEFRGASADGTKVFFTTTQPLLDGAAGLNLYEYDFDAPAGERVIRVSAGDSTVSNPLAELVTLSELQLPLNSDDGSHVYFIAHGVLTNVPNGEGEAAERGAENLYVFERDAQFPSGRIAFVARLSQGDVLHGEARLPAEVTPDGRFLVFASERDLTPDDTSALVKQIFEYDAQAGTLVRVSKGQEGFNHDGNVAPIIFEGKLHGTAILNNASIVAPKYGEYNALASSTHMSVSADGSYVFFQSDVGLTPAALNEKEVVGFTENEHQVYANNIYEYHDGRVSLISDGQDLHYLEFLFVELWGGDASGGDVFFTTADQLVGQDTDTQSDLYDARIGGGFPAPPAPPSCSGDACQGPLSGAPLLLSPGSEFQAGGNPPLAAEAAAKPKPKAKKPKQKGKKRKPGKRSGGQRAKQHGKQATKAAVGGRARKAGR